MKYTHTFIAYGIVAATFAWVSWGMVPNAATAARKPTTHTVTIDGTRFIPETLTVKSGDSVTWVNKDPFPHTATAKDDTFDSDDIASGRSWKFTAVKKGEFPYICTLHPTMKGMLRVE